MVLTSRLKIQKNGPRSTLTHLGKRDIKEDEIITLATFDDFSHFNRID